MIERLGLVTNGGYVEHVPKATEATNVESDGWIEYRNLGECPPLDNGTYLVKITTNPDDLYIGIPTAAVNLSGIIHLNSRENLSTESTIYTCYYYDNNIKAYVLQTVTLVARSGSITARENKIRYKDGNIEPYDANAVEGTYRILRIEGGNLNEQ